MISLIVCIHILHVSYNQIQVVKSRYFRRPPPWSRRRSLSSPDEDNVQAQAMVIASTMLSFLLPLNSPTLAPPL